MRSFLHPSWKPLIRQRQWFKRQELSPPGAWQRRLRRPARHARQRPKPDGEARD